MSDTRRRVKLYALNADRQWDDRGTGHVSSVYVERVKGISLVVRAESDCTILLESKIQPDTAYQKQQDTLIVWSEGDNFDLALSFQEKAGCDEIWEKICHVQGKDPSVEITQDIVEESEDERFEEMSDSAPPIELPPCEIARLENISEIIASGLTSPLRKEKLALALETENYIKKLLVVFNKCEDAQNMEALHHLFEIVKNIFLLNKNALFDIMFTEDTIFDVIGCLEYDPSSTHRKRHRQYLMSLAKFRQAIPITNRDLLAKIHQTFRVQYIQDVVLPTPSVFEDNMLNTLSSFIFFNKVEIVTMVQEDERFLIDLFTVLTDQNTPVVKRRDTVLFLKEFCNYAQNLQPPAKDSFYKTLNFLGILTALETTLAMSDKKTKQASIDILTAIVEYSPSIVRDYSLRSNAREENMLISIAINEMLNDTEPELGGAVQLMGVIKILIDPENMVTSLIKTEKTDFLNLFYKHSMSMIISPLLLNTVGDKPQINDDYHSVQILSLILDLLSFCVEHHTYHVRNCILQKDLLRRILVLMKSTHTFLVLGALRFLRKIIALKDEFYYRYIIKGNLLAPVVDAFIRNNGRYNLLESAILELFEFIKMEDIKSLATHVIENFGKIFDEVDYVQTFKNLRMRYEQHQERLRDRDKSLDNIPPPILRSTRYRRDQRQLDEEEEIWFNEEEDFNEASQNKSDLDTTLDFLGKLIDKKTEGTINNGTKVTQNPVIGAIEAQQQQQQNSPPSQTQTNNNTTTTNNVTNKSDAQKSILGDFIADDLLTPKVASDISDADSNDYTRELPPSSDTTCTLVDTATVAAPTTNSSKLDDNHDTISNDTDDSSSTCSSDKESSLPDCDRLVVDDLKSEKTDSVDTEKNLLMETSDSIVSSGAVSAAANLTTISVISDLATDTKPVVKKGLVDYEGDSDDDDEDELLENEPQTKKQRLA